MVIFATIVAQSLSLSLFLLSFAGAAVLPILLAVAIRRNSRLDKALRPIPIRAPRQRRPQRPMQDCPISESDPGMPLPRRLRQRPGESDSLGD